MGKDNRLHTNAYVGLVPVIIQINIDAFFARFNSGSNCLDIRVSTIFNAGTGTNTFLQPSLDDSSRTPSTTQRVHGSGTYLGSLTLKSYIKFKSDYKKVKRKEYTLVSTVLAGLIGLSAKSQFSDPSRNAVISWSLAEKIVEERICLV